MIKCNELLSSIKAHKPLIHHITNIVTVFDCAQITSLIGALPVMSNSPDETEEMTQISNALVLNIGTLNNKQVEAMILAGKVANSKNIPIILDLVGYGATKLRNEAGKRILESLRIDIIKGNRGEISNLAGQQTEVRGVTTIGEVENIENSCRVISQKYSCIAIATGAIDIIAHNSLLAYVSNGHKMASEIVGTGCMASSILASFAAVHSNRFESSIMALAFYGLCMEQAHQISSDRAGTFKVELFNQVQHLREQDIEKQIKVTLK